ncbi:hypothetical protein L6164_009039 [Bauhinia variegata]|uniref:Uncharacterized protein n=1 Tax=Bauhinia variegata TaxID=167791 RepID=A0ACB9PJY5_BAUVA|nr:hypothetical protein L6164_009039 [Bauhinia variegata]
MRTLGLRTGNSLYLPLTVFLIVLLCFFLYYSSKPIQSHGQERILLKPPSTDHSQNPELKQVLKRASMSDRTVILTMVDEAWARPGSVLDVFLQSFKVGDGTRRFLNHLVIITMDAQAFGYCSSLHPHCIHPSTFVHYFSPTIPNRNLLSWKKHSVLLDVLKLGYNIIFTEADVMWLRSPLSKLNPILELSISCNVAGAGDGYMQDGGLFFLKANAIASEFLQQWRLTKVLYPNPPVEESLCDTIMRNQDVVKWFGFRVNLVNTSHFGGFCQLNKDRLSDVYTMRANCCNNLRSKVHDLRLLLDDWINFRAHSSRKNTLEPMILKWRTPQQCRP